MRGSFPAPPLHMQLLGAYREGWVWELREDHYLLGIGGIWPFPKSPETAAIYFVGTPEADKRPVFLYRSCKAFVEYQLNFFSKLGNIVPVLMSDRVRWMQSLGFDTDLENKHFLDHGCVAMWRTKRPEH